VVVFKDEVGLSIGGRADVTSKVAVIAAHDA
jgi:hypothetical protein